MHQYICWAIGYPREELEAPTGFDARKAYATRHALPVSVVMARRLDIHASWQKHIS